MQKKFFFIKTNLKNKIEIKLKRKVHQKMFASYKTAQVYAGLKKFFNS